MRKRTWSRRRPPGYRPQTAAERMRRMRARHKAAGLRPITTWAPRNARRSITPLDIRLLQARSLALHVMTALKLEVEPQRLAIAYQNLAARWRERESGTPGIVIREWHRALRLPWPKLADLMTAQSEQGLRLRGMTAMLGVLTARERRRVYDAFRRDADPAP